MNTRHEPTSTAALVEQYELVRGGRNGLGPAISTIVNWVQGVHIADPSVSIQDAFYKARRALTAAYPPCLPSNVTWRMSEEEKRRANLAADGKTQGVYMYCDLAKEALHIK
jgi:hypothetical protein